MPKSGQVELPLQLGVQIGVASAGIRIDRDRQRPGGTQVGQLPGPDPVGAGQGLDQQVGGGVDLQPILAGGRVVLEVGVDGVGDHPEAALAQLGLEHQGAVEIIEDVVEAGVDVGVDPADAEVALQRHCPEIGRDAELPGVGLRLFRRRRSGWAPLAAAGSRRRLALREVDRDIAVERLAHAGGGRHERGVLALGADCDRVCRHPQPDELGAHRFGPPRRQLLVVGRRAGPVGAADQRDPRRTGAQE